MTSSAHWWCRWNTAALVAALMITMTLPQVTASLEQSSNIQDTHSVTDVDHRRWLQLAHAGLMMMSSVLHFLCIISVVVYTNVLGLISIDDCDRLWNLANMSLGMPVILLLSGVAIQFVATALALCACLGPMSLAACAPVILPMIGFTATLMKAMGARKKFMVSRHNLDGTRDTNAAAAASE